MVWLTTMEEDLAEESPHAYLKAMLVRLRIEMLSSARALQGDLLVEFWEIVDDLNAIRPKRTLGDPP
jgi:hypothetical protein